MTLVAKCFLKASCPKIDFSNQWSQLSRCVEIPVEVYRACLSSGLFRMKDLKVEGTSFSAVGQRSSARRSWEVISRCPTFLHRCPFVLLCDFFPHLETRLLSVLSAFSVSILPRFYREHGMMAHVVCILSADTIWVPKLLENHLC